jgi:hypothetical protein
MNLAPITRKKTIKHVVNGYGLKCGCALYHEVEQQVGALLHDICRTHIKNVLPDGHTTVNTSARQQSLELTPVH